MSKFSKETGPRGHGADKNKGGARADALPPCGPDEGDEHGGEEEEDEEILYEAPGSELLHGRDFFEALDEGLVKNAPAFLYIHKYNVDGDELVLRHHDTDQTFTDLVVAENQKGRRILSANLVTDPDYNILAVVWFYKTNGRHEAYFARVEEGKKGVTISDPLPISFPNVIAPLMVRLVPSGDHFYFACVDARSDLPWSFCLATLDINSLEPTSRVTEMDVKVSASYSTPEERQFARNLTLVPDYAGGAFLQLVNDMGHIETYRLSPPEQGGAVGYQRLYSVAHDDIGYHATLYDPVRSRLVTCFSVYSVRDGQQPVLGYSQPIFTGNAAEEDAVSFAFPALPQFVQLNVRPGKYYRPEISHIPSDAGGEGTYLVSWEGETSVRFAEFTPNFEPTSTEYSVDSLSFPGNHRTVATPKAYGVCYQNQCVEPRFAGLSFESQLIERQAVVADVQSGNTYWLPGLNILFDDTYRNLLKHCDKTSANQHLVGVYQSIEGSNRRIYGRVHSATGLTLPPTVLTPQAPGIDKDFQPAPIPESNDFAGIWSSNQQGGNYRIYVRKYMVDGRQGIQYFNSEQQLSGSDNHYICPRIIYNEEAQLFFACWISIKEKTLQGIWMSLNGNTFSAASYPVTITSALYTNFLNYTAEIDENVTQRIVLMNHGDGVIVALQEAASKINFFRVGRPVMGGSAVNLMLSYSHASMGRFAAVYDPLSSHIMLVFIAPTGGVNGVLGMRLRVFNRRGRWYARPSRGRGGHILAPVQLNMHAKNMRTPNIIILSEKNGEHEFLVSWCEVPPTPVPGPRVDPVYFSKFDMFFNRLGREKEVNRGAVCGPGELAASENQIAFMFHSTHIDGVTLRSEGVLSNVASVNVFFERTVEDDGATAPAND